MKTRNKVLIVLLLFGIVLLFSSTKILLTVTGYNLKKQDIDVSMATEESVNYHIGKFSSPEGIMRIISFEGWALNPGYKTNSRRHVSLILKSEDTAYEVPSTGYSRPDVSTHFSNLKLDPNDLGFTGKFSILALQDGTYELFIKAWEVGKAPFLRSTNKIFVKTGESFEELPNK